MIPAARAARLLLLALLAAVATAAPVPVPVTATKPAAPLSVQLTQALVSAHASAKKLFSVLQSVAPAVGGIAAPPLLLGSVTKEYDAMARWWCTPEHASKAVCMNRAFTLRLRQEKDPEAKKALLKSKPKTDPAGRKALVAESKAMLTDYCQREGAHTQLCVRSLGVYEASKRLLAKRKETKVTVGSLA